MSKNPGLRWLSFLLLLLALAGTTACAKNAEPPSASTPTSGAGMPRAQRDLAVTANMAVTVERADDASARIRDAVEKAGGYVSNANADGDKTERVVHMDLRVPRDKLRSVRDTIASQGDVTTDNERVDDVTEQRADLAARLHNARVQEKRLLEIMAAKAGNISELIDAEKELARVRENVERLDAQERGLSGKVELATLSVTVSTKGVATWQKPGEAISRAGVAGAHAALSIATYTAMVLAAVLPTLVPVALITMAIYLVVRWRRRARQPVMVG
jgi:hypothetical protein